LEGLATGLVLADGAIDADAEADAEALDATVAFAVGTTRGAYEGVAGCGSTPPSQARASTPISAPAQTTA
jgi:hypothetical protein